MKLIIAGGRDFTDFPTLEYETQKFILESKGEPSNITIISGKAEGADTLGERFARKWRFPVTEMPADWNNLDAIPCKVATRRNGTKYNLLAGHNRNEEMAKIATHCICFWNGSGGTGNMIENANKYDLILKIIPY